MGIVGELGAWPPLRSCHSQQRLQIPPRGPRSRGGWGSGAELSPVDNHQFKGDEKTHRLGWLGAHRIKSTLDEFKEDCESRADRI